VLNEQLEGLNNTHDILRLQPSDSGRPMLPNILRTPSAKPSDVQPGTSSSQQQPPEPPSLLPGQSYKDAPQVDTDQRLTTPFSPCNVVIAELATRNTENLKSFIELQRVCPPKSKKHTKVSLAGYLLLRISAGDPMFITMFVNLNEQRFIGVVEGGGVRGIINHYFVLGHEVPESDLSIKKEYIAGDGDYIGFARAGEVATAVVLLYVPEQAISNVEKNLKLRMVRDHAVPRLLTEEKEVLINQYMQDVIVYGPPCSSDDCRLFEQLLKAKDQIVSQDNIFLPMPETETDSNGAISFKSLNRCTDSINPMERNSWAEGVPTPKQKNNCPKINDLSLPFTFQGKMLQTTAQELIVNLYTFFQKASIDNSLLVGKPEDLTSRATTLSGHTLTNTLKNYREKNIKTPGKRKPNHPFPV